MRSFVFDVNLNKMIIVMMMTMMLMMTMMPRITMMMIMMVIMMMMMTMIPMVTIMMMMIMIRCDFCDMWYHPECLGLTTQQVLSINKIFHKKVTSQTKNTTKLTKCFSNFNIRFNLKCSRCKVQTGHFNGIVTEHVMSQSLSVFFFKR